MNYVGICFFNDVGRCLCGPVAAGGGNTLAVTQTNSAVVSDIRLSLPGGSMSVPAPMSLAAAGGGGGSAAQTAVRLDSVVDRGAASGASQPLSAPGGSASAPVAMASSTSAGGQDEAASQTATSQSAGDSIFGRSAAISASQGWSGGGGGSGGASGGAPAPEVNAGLGLLLAGITVAYLRRRRVRRARAAWTNAS